jgi:putative tryptophan/tyrosine transport system ATP-binding protein
MIRIQNLHKRFNQGTANEVYALRGVNLNIQAGEFITIIGTNGSGKSTILNAIAGAFQPDSGSVEVNGHDMTGKFDFQRAKYISRVFQNPFMGTASEMSIAENLHMAYLRGKIFLPVFGLNKHGKLNYAKEIKQLEMQLEGRLDTVIGTLSGGQRQAVTLLMSIITRPDVLLLDEHTAALDPKSAAQVIKLTKKFIKRDKLTAVMVTHSMHQALELGDRTIMMDQGKIIEDISLQEKKQLTVDDLLNKFSELRKVEQLTDEMMEKLRQEYV